MNEKAIMEGERKVGNGAARVEILVVPRKAHRKGVEMVAGIIPAGVLVGRYAVPRRDFYKKTGYQREVSMARVKHLVKDLSDKNVDLPTAVLLNIRDEDYDPKTNFVQRKDSTYLSVNGDTTFYVVDGQHRVLALDLIIQEDPEKWAAFEVPFVCMLGANEREEMEQFYIVNSTAKSVRTDLALDLLKQRAETDSVLMEDLNLTGGVWKVKAQGIVEQLARTTVWRGLIRFPGQAPAETIISSGGMVSSLKQVLQNSYFERIPPESQVKILDAYWQGIRIVLPDVLNEPFKHALQKTTGVTTMHALLPAMLEIVRSQGQSVIDPKSYADVLRQPLSDLRGDTASGDEAEGQNFWLAGPDGAAGSFSSNAGRRVLLAKIRAMLPQASVE
ncbi:MAG: DGQHR domain-containing protein [candidate division Zixibacteria bacterium]|nr:DGQHR domain-containing protein [candidate division Zixibacteria bacterium]